MPKLSWSEIRDRAVVFSREWATESSERAESQSFWNDFFNVFGIGRRSVASFEAPVRRLTGHVGKIDLFWKGRLLVEQKSRGQDLSRAEGQAFAYVQALTSEGRHDEVPRYVLVSDFERIALFDLESADISRPIVFRLGDLHRHVRDFAFMLGQTAIRVDPEDPANEHAYDRMCALHDALEAGGCKGPELERMLVRVLFCLFAEDTGLFAPDAFTSFLRQTRENGSDLAAQLNQFFYVLDTPISGRPKTLDAELAELPYVNGQLFKDRLGFPGFNSDMRRALIECAEFYWAKISPAVFGSLFQGVLDAKERRKQGAHYTSERDILRVLRSLFLDDLSAEFERIKADRSNRRAANIEAFHARLRSLKFLDPACGCGSFLVLAYRELRTLEIEVVRERLAGGQQLLDVRTYFQVDVDQFFGIELDEWPVRIAEVAMWLMDHQMNVRASEVFGKYFERLPLVTSPHIVRGNALRMAWGDLLPRTEASYVVGNPPFIGKQFRSAEQQADMQAIWGDVSGAGVLNYVTAWYRKAADYIQGLSTRVAFVSTNSIANGEQVGILWGDLYKKKMVIQFGHRTFPWTSDARGQAHVHVVIIGFGQTDVAQKNIYDYEINGEHERTEGTVSRVKNISPYLIEGGNFAVTKRQTPLCNVRPMSFGNMPNDGGHLLLTDEQRAELLAAAPNAAKFIRPFVGPDELVKGKTRWCLWLVDADPGEIRRIAPLVTRIEAVRTIRSNSPRSATKALASKPMLFGEIRQPTQRYLGVPKTGSERRRYIPMAFFDPEVIASTDLLTVEGAGYYEFGVLSSSMHMAWVNTVGGRFKSDPRYSATLIYNTFPWPDAVDKKRRAAVESAALDVERARAQFLEPTGTNSLGDLYDPLTTPVGLVNAHVKLDRAVELCYRPEPFKNGERQRLEWLMAMYASLMNPSKPTTPVRRSKRTSETS